MLLRREWIHKNFGWQGLETLVLLGVAMQALYVVFFALASLLPVTTPFASEVPLEAPALVVWFVSYVTFLVLLFVAYCFAMRTARGKSLDPLRLRNWILLFAGLFAVTLLFLPVLFSHDLFSYIIYGRIFSVYQNNPYTTVPIEVATDPFIKFVDWKGVPSVYGPVWTIFSVILTTIGGANVSLQVLAFKSGAIALHLANVFLVWQMLSKLNPRWRATGTLLYAWNPLTAIEFAGNGHNDVMMLFFVFLSVYAYVNNRKYLGLAFLTLSVLTKFITVLLLPMYILLLLRKEADNRSRGWLLVRSAVIIGVLFFGLWLPFWAGFSTVFALKSAPALSEYVNSLPQVVFWGVRSLLQFVFQISDLEAYSTGDLIVRYGSEIFFGIFMIRMLVDTRTYDHMLSNWFKALFVYLVFIGTWFWPWYVTWLVALAALHDRPRTLKLTVLFSFSVLLAYAL
ncbi:MAG: hypothetical protein M1305_04140, partial [Candidatus Marsarchaeota archaeon]|nr:hypothetical protein [Candidatus Marsarchaeota archaeon]